MSVFGINGCLSQYKLEKTTICYICMKDQALKKYHMAFHLGSEATRCFEPSDSFQGQRKGFAFKLGDRGAVLSSRSCWLFHWNMCTSQTENIQKRPEQKYPNNIIHSKKKTTLQSANFLAVKVWGTIWTIAMSKSRASFGRPSWKPPISLNWQLSG